MDDQDALHALYADYDFDPEREWRPELNGMIDDLVDTKLRIEDYENCPEEGRPLLEKADRDESFVRLLGFLFMLKEMLDNQKLLLTDEKTIKSCVNYTWSRIRRANSEQEENELLNEAQNNLLTQVPEVAPKKGRKSG